MPKTIYTTIKEYFAEVKNHKVKARILSPVNEKSSFIFQINYYYTSKNYPEGHKPLSTFNSFATAERHLLQYIEDFQNTIDLGGNAVKGIEI